MRRKIARIKQIIAMFLIVALLPLESLEGCFAERVYAATNTVTNVTENVESSVAENEQTENSGASEEDEYSAQKNSESEELESESDSLEENTENIEDTSADQMDSVSAEESSVIEETEDSEEISEATEEIQESEEESVLENLLITENYTLTGDLEVADMQISGGTFDLNGYRLIVHGELVQSAGVMEINGGSLIVEGDYRIQTRNGEEGAYTYGKSSGQLWMGNKADYVHVYGDVVNDSEYSSPLQYGIFEIDGNLTSTQGIICSESHKFVFSGDARQIIDISESEFFGIIELRNQSEEGIYSAYPFAKRALIRNGCKIDYAGVKGTYGWVLEEDTVYEGDLVLIDDTLDLNGHSLTVTGDLIQLSGIVNVHSGSLTVEGDYRIQVRTGKEGAYSYSASAGLLYMTNKNDYVLVKRNFIFEDIGWFSSELSTGILEVQGDVNIIESNRSCGLRLKGNHTLLLSGQDEQTIGGNGVLEIQNIEITNESEGGVIFSDKPYVAGRIKDQGKKVSGYISIGSSTTFEQGYFGGSIYIGKKIDWDDVVCIGGDVEIVSNTTISGSIIVKGSLNHTSGELILNSGILEILGNYTAEYAYRGTNSIYMTHEEDYVHVHGDVEYSPHSSGTLSAGTFEIGGNLTSTQGIQASGSHKFLFSGNSLQTIDISIDAIFATLELQNYSEEGINLVRFFRINALIHNNCTLTSGEQKFWYGWILEEDTVHEGDMVLIGDTLDLNGYSLTVTGDLVQLSGIVKVNGGSLIVEKNYRIQTRNGKEGCYTYNASCGQLQMTNEDDYVLVKGSFISETSANTIGYLTAGILEVKSNVYVSNSYSNASFVGMESHTLLLSGENRQSIYSDIVGISRMRLQNLEITNESEEGVVISNKPYVSGHVKDYGNRISGYIAIGTDTTFEEGYFGGSIYINEDVTLDDVLTIGGDVYMTHNVTISGSIHVKGNFEQHGSWINSNLCMDKGRLEIDGNYYIANESYTRVYMTHVEDHIHVHGNVTYEPYSSGSLSAGTFEIGGALSSSGNMHATGSHKFVFSGDSKQVINITTDEYFATVELRNYSEEGVYSPITFKKSTLIRNGCRLTYGDLEGEYGWTLEEDTVYEGDMVLIEDTLDLNGHSLTVTGDLVQLSGIVKVNGGSLTVEGDYRIQTRSGADGSYTYGESSGQLQMIDEDDYVLVKGSFISGTSANATGYLTAGILEVRGDVNVSSSYSSTGFVGTGSHTLLLSGVAKQTFSFGTFGSDSMRLQNLEITNESEDGVVFSSKPCVFGHVKDHGNKVSGLIAIGTDTTFEEGYFGGGIYISQGATLDDVLIIGGDLELRGGTTTVTGSIKVEGNCIHSGDTYLTMNKGSLEVRGNYTVAYQRDYYNYISMTHTEDYIHVHGDVVYSPCSSGTLSAG
ncbi:MAG: hypothetical protein IKL04_06060, partial [Lachnospiraceae bacterium]|nr:hypothetical protein [Lachnospiraceae bacterium]